MSLCHKPFVYKGWASDIKWHYRAKSDIKIENTPIFGVLLPIIKLPDSLEEISFRYSVG